MNQNAEKFAEKNVEVIAIFREEADGLAGLQKIKDKSEVEFTLAIDKDAEKTKAYSPGRMEFTSYVVGSDGVIRGTIKGDLRTRAKGEELMKIIDALSDKDDK